MAGLPQENTKLKEVKDTHTFPRIRSGLNPHSAPYLLAMGHQSSYLASLIRSQLSFLSNVVNNNTYIRFGMRTQDLTNGKCLMNLSHFFLFWH